MNFYKKNIRYALYGGSFNPFHDGHHKVCNYILDNNIADKIVLVIDNKKFFNNKCEQISLEHKRKIIKLFIKNNTNIIIDDTFYNKNIKYFYEYVKIFKLKYNTNNINIIIGLDQLINFSKWNNWKLLLLNSNLLVFKRSCKNAISTIKSANIKILDNSLYMFSSTEIRSGKKLYKYNPKLVEYINYFSLFYFERLTKYLSNPRRSHSINVGNLASKAAEIHNMDPNLAFFAGVYHDYFKEIKNEIIFNKLLNMLNIDSSDIPLPAIHGIIAAKYLEKKWFYINNDVLNSIKNHTIPTVNMSKMEKLIFCADKLSYERNNNYADNLRPTLFKNIDKCFSDVLFNNIIYLVNNKKIFNNHYEKLIHIYLTKSQINYIKTLLISI